MWKCSMESINNPRTSIPSVQVTDVAHSLWSNSSSWVFYKGIHFTKHFDVIRKQKAVWISDHTTQVLMKMIKCVVPELIFVAHQTPFTWCRKRFTITDMKYTLSQATMSLVCVTSRQRAVIYCSKKQIMQNWCRCFAEANIWHQTMSETKRV